MPTLNELAAVAHPPGTLAASVSVFSAAASTVVESLLPLQTILSGIRDGQWAAPVAAVRAAVKDGDRERVANLKKRLPAFSVSAALRTRAREADDRVITHSGWLQADFDSRENPSMVQADARAALMADPHSGAVFIGPSGTGIKAIVRIDDCLHAESVSAAVVYFRERHGLHMDRSCRDIERLCFVSHDPEAWMREAHDSAAILPVPAGNTNNSRAGGPRTAAGTPIQIAWKAADVRELLGWLPKTRPDYDTWLRVISGVSSVLPREEAIACLTEWCPPEKPGEYEAKWRHRLSHVTIRSVIRMAQAHGFDAAAASRRQRWMGRLLIGGRRFGPPPAENTDLLSGDPEPDTPDCWDTWKHLKDQQMGDASIFAAKLGHVWKYDVLVKRWRNYCELTGLWEQDIPGTVTLEARSAAVESYSGLIETILEEKAAKTDAREIKVMDAELRELKTRMSNLGKSHWCSGIMSFAEKMPSLICRATDFDKSRHLLAVENGVLDFQADAFLDFDRNHRLSIAAPVCYEAGATCPAFDSFLETCMDGDQELISYLWRLIGYSLTGFVDHDALFFCYGTGANGKSTFFLVMQMLLGAGLSTVIDIATLLGGSHESGSTVDYKKSMLEGKRLVMTDEIPDDRRFNESMVKQLLGGEDVVARRPYEMPYTFSPTHKIWAVGNHKPRIKGTDHGIWRRMHLIPWLVTIPQHKRRPRQELIASFRRELSGILNGALAGYGDFLDRDGLAPPAAVLAATEEYRQEEDSFGTYLEDRLAPSSLPGAAVKLTALLADYLEWCHESGESPIARSAKKFVAALRQRSLRVENIGSGATAHLLGMRLLSQKTATMAGGQIEIPF
jgi:P4 family phage/plasmid primase-like protien